MKLQVTGISGGGSGGAPKFNYELLTGTNAETLALGSAYQVNISGDDDKPLTIPDTTETGQLILVARESNGDDTGNAVISVAAGSSTRIRTPDNQVATSYTLGNSGSNTIQAVLLMSSENSAGDAEYLAIQLGEHSDIPSDADINTLIDTRIPESQRLLAASMYNFY